MDREQWLAERRTGIGSSDAPVILGLTPPTWGSRLELYLDKIGKPVERRETAEMRMGVLLEPVLAQLWESERGRKLRKPAIPIQRHPERSWQICTCDWLDGDEGIVEGKTVGAFQASDWGDPGTDQVPDYVLVQVQHQLAVTGRRRADVAALFGGQSFGVYQIERHDGLIDQIILQEQTFWAHVQRREPPLPDWRQHVTADALRLLFGFDEAELLELGQAELALAREYESLGEIKREAEEAREQCKAKLLWAMKAARRAVLPDGSEIFRSEVTRKAHQVAECTYQKLRIKLAARACGATEVDHRKGENYVRQ